MDKFTCFISSCSVSVADMVTLSLLPSFHRSPCLHSGVQHRFGKLVGRCPIVVACKLAFILASKNPPLAVPGLDIEFVFSPSVCLCRLVNFLGKEGLVEQLQKPPPEVNALVTEEDGVILLLDSRVF